MTAAGGSPDAAGTPAAPATSAAGIHGLAVTLRPQGATRGKRLSIALDTSALNARYGADYAERAQLVVLPSCSLTSPEQPGCLERLPLATRYDRATSRLTATVTLPAPRIEQRPTTHAAIATPDTTDAQVMTVATVPGTSGPDGTYAATSLQPSSQWSSGGSDGSFDYSYPVQTPPSLGGDAPQVALSYDLSSLDGRTSATNAQPSWIGDGWDFSPGFIERSYKSCDKDGITNSGDDCWGGYNARLSLGGRTTVLVRDDTTSTWHLKDDDGTKVDFLTGAGNGATNGEYVKVTLPSGVVDYFGINHLPGGDRSDPATNSAWTQPVYSPKSTDPCYDSSKGNASWCQMPWRWNLDYSVDTHGNLTTYMWTRESNDYSRGAGQNQGNGTLTAYTSGGALASISYGQTLSAQVAAKGTAKAAARIVFTPAPAGRCSTAGSYDCTGKTLSSSNASHWPDVPYDQHCGTTGTCQNFGPTFWTNVTLSSISTQVLSAGNYANVDKYTLTHTFEDPQDGTDPGLWLSSVKR